jgi:hypothetical protein
VNAADVLAEAAQRIRRTACNLPQMGKEHLEALWKALTRGGGEIVAEWFMLFVFGISAGSAVAALYARHQQ